MVKYKRSENVFYCAADEAQPRHVSAGLVLDYDSLAGADKYGSLFVLRLPTEISAQVPLLAWLHEHSLHGQTWEDACDSKVVHSKQASVLRHTPYSIPRRSFVCWLASSMHGMMPAPALRQECCATVCPGAVA